MAQEDREPTLEEINAELASRQPSIEDINAELARRELSRRPGFAERAGLSFKTTQEGQIGFLESIYGNGNVVPTGNGSFVVNEPGKKPVVVDPAGFELSDLADLAGPAVQVLPELVSRRIGAREAATRGGIGSAARQAVSESLPGDDNIGFTERGADVVLSSLMGAAANTVGNKVVDLLDLARPRNIVGRLAKKAIDKGDSIPAEEEMIAALTLGQRTGSKSLQRIEQAIATSPKTADRFNEFIQKQREDAFSRLDDALESLSPVGSAEGTGRAVEDAYKGAVKKAFDTRRRNAKRLFGKITDLERGKAFNVRIPTDNTLDRLDELIDQFSALSSKQDKAVRNEIVDIRSNIEGPGRRVNPLTGQVIRKSISVRRLQDLLSRMSAASAGNGRLFEGLDIGTDRRIASSLLDALNKDLDDAVLINDGLTPDIATALREARDVYRQDSRLIKGLQETTLGRLLNRVAEPSPEKISNAMLQLSPSEIRVAMEIIEDSGPQAANAVRRRAFEQAIERGVTPVSTDPAAALARSPDTFTARSQSPSKFISSLPSEDKLNAIMGSKQAAKQIRAITRTITRMAGRAEGSSPTAPLQEVFRAIYDAAAGQGIRVLARAAAMDRMADLVLTTKGRQALLSVLRTGGVETPIANKALAANRGALFLLGTELVPDTEKRQQRE